MIMTSPRCSLRLLRCFALFMLVITGLCLVAQAQALELTATDSHGTLHVTIPYHLARGGAGHLTVEILNPKGHVLGPRRRNGEIDARGEQGIAARLFRAIAPRNRKSGTRVAHVAAVT